MSQVNPVWLNDVWKPIINAKLGDHGPAVPSYYLIGLTVHLSSGYVNGPDAMHTAPDVSEQHVDPD